MTAALAHMLYVKLFVATDGGPFLREKEVEPSNEAAPAICPAAATGFTICKRSCPNFVESRSVRFVPSGKW